MSPVLTDGQHYRDVGMPQDAKPPPICHCERSEAISGLLGSSSGDCFVAWLLAMTNTRLARYYGAAERRERGYGWAGSRNWTSCASVSAGRASSAVPSASSANTMAAGSRY